MSEDIIERLRTVLSENDDAVARQIIADAITQIEFLRTYADAVTRGENFDEIAKRVGRQPKDDA